MIRWYNELVDDQDRVYILGDVAFSPANMQNSIGRMKGRKVLVPGNHEPPKMREYFDLFDDVRGYVVKKGFIMSHIPIHPGSLHQGKLNIHGHTHSNSVNADAGSEYMQPNGTDSRYFCACVEQTNFRPILLDDILKARGVV